MATVKQCPKCGAYFNADDYMECPYCSTPAEAFPEDEASIGENPVSADRTNAENDLDALVLIRKEAKPGKKTEKKREPELKAKEKQKAGKQILRLIAIALAAIALGCAAFFALHKFGHTETLQIITQPADFIGKVGDTAEFSIEAEGVGLQYHWEYSEDGEAWKESSSKGHTASCEIKEEKNGRRYRCTVSDGSGNSIVSGTAELRVATLKITEQPQDLSGEDGARVSFTIKASGEGLTYAWQYSDDGGKTWTPSESTGEIAFCTINKKHDGRLYCCLVGDQYGNMALSNVAMLSMR